jgi:hypothetical protein
MYIRNTPRIELVVFVIWLTIKQGMKCDSNDCEVWSLDRGGWWCH